MNSQELGTKAAVIVDTTVATTVKHAVNAKCAVATFFSAFRTELAARRAARNVPEVHELSGTANPF